MTEQFISKTPYLIKLHLKKPTHRAGLFRPQIKFFRTSGNRFHHFHR